ncbi:Na+/H+ antiporter NhaC family protein [Aminivibrio sp.]|uniref:Na+/H+ antiporter NhaC family protein n=1 Tax=Aminivibrio sp. TaxID=1872489 RepID=UPI001A4422B1|nr:Na+/H+ antiporter NhaC family protein [Aminivibrio sp.]MBL3538667.1 Na+/H+ antiporter NhaC [Aminivibrio sp.]
MAQEERQEDISAAGALTVLGGILAILAGGTLVFGIHIAVLLVFCGIFTTALFRMQYGFGWRLLFVDGVLPMVSRASGAMGILLSVGPLIAAWTLSGTIPYLVFTGLNLLTPRIFLPAAFLLCSFASLLTGTSWGTAGTFGVALTAIAGGLGIPEAAAAGAIVGGAYFGDKLSPVSDTTVLAAAVAEVDVMDHIRSTLRTTLPGAVLSVAVYAAAGSGAGGAMDTAGISAMTSALSGRFFLSPVLLLPPLVLLFMAWKRFSTLAALWTSVGLALPLALFQGYGPGEILAAMAAGPRAVTGNQAVDELLGRGGLLFLAGVAAVVCAAYVFAGQLEATGTFRRVSTLLQKKFIGRSRGKFVLSASLTGVTVAVATGNSYLSEILPGTMYKDLADEMDISRRVLSRTLEDSGTVVVPLVPWSAAAVYMSAVLGVSAWEYLPWAVICYSGVPTAWLFAFFGIAIWPSDKKKAA